MVHLTAWLLKYKNSFLLRAQHHFFQNIPWMGECPGFTSKYSNAGGWGGWGGGSTGEMGLTTCWELLELGHGYCSLLFLLLHGLKFSMMKHLKEVQREVVWIALDLRIWRNLKVTYSRHSLLGDEWQSSGDLIWDSQEVLGCFMTTPPPDCPCTSCWTGSLLCSGYAIF